MILKRKRYDHQDKNYSWLHLFLNAFVFISFYRVICTKTKYLLLQLILIAFSASFFAQYSLPTVGASGMIYAMIGMYLFLLYSKNIRIPKKDVWLFLFSIAFMFTLSVFNTNSNYALHASCLCIGFCWSLYKKLLRY